MLIRQTILYLPAQFVSPVAQFLSMMIWTWWLTPEEMASFVLVTATQELAYMFSRSWFSFYTLRFLPLPDDSAGRRRFLDTEATLLLVQSVPEIAAAALSISFFHGAADPWTVMAIIALYYVSRGMSNHFAERARAQNAILAYTLLQVSGTAGGLLAGLLALNLVAPTAAALLVAYGVMQVAGIAIALPMIGLSLRLSRLDAALMRRALVDGGPMLIVNCFGWLAENNIRYIVDHIGGPAAFGLMAVGWGIGRRCASVAALLVTAAAFPLAARMMNEGDRAGAFRQLTINAALLSAVLFPAMTGLALVGGLITDLAVAEAYRQTTRDVLALAALGGMVRFYHLHVSDQVLLLERKYGRILAVNVFEALMTAVLAVVGYESDGLVGVVTGALVASCLALALSSFLAVRECGFRFPLADTARIALATAIMAAAVAVVPVPPTAAGLAASIAVGAVVYASAMSVIYFPKARPMVARLMRRSTRGTPA